MSMLTRPANRPRRSLRRALLTASLVMALVPMLGLSLLLGLRQIDDSRNQVVELLTSVAVLKEAEIRTWFNSLSPQLVLLTATPRTNADFLALIDQPSATRRSTTPQRSHVLATFAALLDNGRFQEVFLMDAAGTVVISTRPEREGQSFATQPFFQRGRQHAYTQSPFYSLLHDQMIVYAAAPIYDSDELAGANTTARGVLVGVTNLATLSSIMRERGGLGETGETYLVSSDFIMLTEARRPLTNRLAAVRTVGAYTALAGRNGWASYDNFEYPPLPVVGVYRWIPELNVALLAEQSQAEAFAGAVGNVWLTVSVTLIVAVLAIVAAVAVSRNLARPIEQLTDTARRMAQGDLNQPATLTRTDEIGELADAFNGMADQLHKMIGGLEDRVNERTAALQVQEAQLRHTSAELARSNEELKQFAYIVSHDLRAPLVNLKGFATELKSAIEVINHALYSAAPPQTSTQFLAAAHALNDDIPEALAFIDVSVTRMDHYLSALLRLSRLGRTELILEQVSMEAVVRETLQTLAHRIEAQHTQITLGPLPEVTADLTAMEQIMSNLLNNAVLYLDPQRPGQIDIRGEAGSLETTFYVRDNGRGIAADDMENVFAPFRRGGHQDVPGEGMGLAYVQLLVRRHGGRIECESQPGVGSTFTFTIANQIQAETARNGETGVQP